MIYTHVINQGVKGVESPAIFSLGCQCEQHVQRGKREKK